MRKCLILAAGAALSLSFTGLAQRAQAATITVPNSNFQFESDGVTSIPSGTGTYQKGNADTSQVKNGAATYDILGWTFGTGDNNSGVFNSSGTYGAFSESGDTMQQILPVSSGTVKVGDTYTLITSVSGTFNSLGLTMSVYAYNTATQAQTLIASASTGPVANGTTADFQASGTAPAGTSGQQLLIQLASNGTTASNGYQNLGNVRLTDTPEPASVSAFALGGLGLLGRRRRRA